MGTRFKILLYAPDEEVARRAAQAAFGRIGVLDAIMSDYRPASELMRLCKKAGGPPVRVSDDLFIVLERAQEVSRLSGGAFDVTIGPVGRMWRWARHTHEPPDPERLLEARRLVGYEKMRLDPRARTVKLDQPGMLLDLGGIAKGYAADEALRALRRQGVDRALVAAGGDIAVSGPPPGTDGWRVGIAPLEDPEREPTRYLLLKDAAVSTSGDAEQHVEIGGKRYSHIIDPRTGTGLEGRSSATVVGPSGLVVDPLTKVVAVLGAKKGFPLIEKQGAAGLVVRKTERGEEVTRSRGFPETNHRGTEDTEEKKTEKRGERGRTVQGDHGVVVAGSAEASEVGVEILKKGGNAVDAAVAVAFALAVTLPEAGNIGGGGFMMVYPGHGAKPVAIDYRETAPRGVGPDTFAATKSHLGHRIVGVPGTVHGLARAHRRFGKLPWKEVVQPAVRLAEDGFPLTPYLADSLNKIVKKSADFAEFRRVYGKDGGRADWHAGDRLVLSDLARTLRLIADEGPRAFYHGKIAEQIASEMEAGGGYVTQADLALYEAKLRTPLHTTYRGYDVYCPPAPSGGVCLVEMLNTLETFDLRKHGRWSPETIHLMIETMRRAYCDRARYLGDPDFIKIPEHLTSKEYARRLPRSINPDRATPSAELARDIPLDEGDHTTHFSVIDADGMAVANTYTLEHSYGSRVVVRGAGFLLNNEMGDFNWRPGHTDRRGAIGTAPNQVVPGRRMLSSQTPTIVAKDGKVVLVTGSPGGRTIINTVLSVVLNVLEFDMDVRAAVDAPRFHHPWFPDRLAYEAALAREHPDLLRKLEAMGHTISPKPEAEDQGDAHSIAVDPRTGRRTGAADNRRDGAAAGY